MKKEALCLLTGFAFGVIARLPLAPDVTEPSEISTTTASDPADARFQVFDAAQERASLRFSPRNAGQESDASAGSGELAAAGGLSLDASNQPLLRIADQIGRKTGVAVVLAEELRDVRHSVRFSGLSAEAALHRTFAGYDRFALFSHDLGDAPRLTSLWVYPRGEGPKWAPIPSPLEASRRELIADTQNGDALKRAQATAALVERNGNDAVEAVRMALTDADDRVRFRVLDAALHGAVELDRETLEGLFRQDPSPTVRSLALDGLARTEQDPDTVTALLEAALGDPSAEVSQLAASLLENRRTGHPNLADASPQVPAGNR